MLKSISGKINTSTGALCVQSFFSVWAVMLLGGLSTRSILPPVLFAAFLYFFGFAKVRKNGTLSVYSLRISVIAPVLSGVFSLFTLMAEHGKFTAGLENRLFQAILLLAGCLGVFFLFYHFLLLLFGALSDYRL